MVIGFAAKSVLLAAAFLCLSKLLVKQLLAHNMQLRGFLLAICYVRWKAGAIAAKQELRGVILSYGRWSVY